MYCTGLKLFVYTCALKDICVMRLYVITAKFVSTVAIGKYCCIHWHVVFIINFFPPNHAKRPIETFRAVF
jgi:hypothetical protein